MSFGLFHPKDMGPSDALERDMETWMFPNFLLLHPDIASSMLEYRFQRLPAALAKANASGHAGAQFPWESAFTGTRELKVCDSSCYRHGLHTYWQPRGRHRNTY